MGQSKTDATPAHIIQEMVSRIANECHPHKIILFGSRARGEAQRGSDVEWREVKSHFHTALREGRVLYEKPA
jgi:predicted nucleotidyltransferase